MQLFGTLEAEELFINDSWNKVFCKQLVYEIEKNYLDINFHETISLLESNESKKIFKSFRIKKLAKVFLLSLLKYSWRSKKYVFVSIGISAFSLILLRLFLPGRLYVEPGFPRKNLYKYSYSQRMWKLPLKSKDRNFENFIRKILPLWMPTIFVEGFKDEIVNLDRNKKLPKDPDVIFSSTSHFLNDSFKIWAAKKIDEGAKLVCGQHGGGPFHLFSGGIQQELELSDLYMTTGKGNKGFKNIRNVGQFFARFKKEKWKLDGNAVVVTGLMPKYISIYALMLWHLRWKAILKISYYFIIFFGLM